MATRYPKDPGLSARMAVTIFLLGLLYVAFIGALLAVGVSYGVVIVIAGALLFAQYFFSDKIALFSMHARVVSEQEAPELHAIGAPVMPRGANMLSRPMKSVSSDSVRQEWLAAYASGMAASEDYGVAVARDANGNVYVAGYGDSSTTGNDILTIKYSNTGIKQWKVRYNGSSNGEDRPSKIAVDASGNVYVAGYSEGSGTRYDYVTLKYNSNGLQQWAVRYNGPANGDDIATALAFDGLGNVTRAQSSRKEDR